MGIGACVCVEKGQHMATVWLGRTYGAAQAGMTGVDLRLFLIVQPFGRARSLHLTPRSSNQSGAHSSLPSGRYFEDAR
jgi:hypothetical protein